MRSLSLKNSNQKKVRGLKKKCSAMVKAIAEQTNHFPVEYSSEEYWHCHLPVAQSFIDSTHTPRSVRKLCIQAMIDRANFLAQHKHQTAINCRVICLVSLPDLWASEIIIFFTQDYFEKFFNRNSPWQKWILLNDRDITKEYNLIIPNSFQVKGYKHEGYDEDNPKFLTYTGEIWAIGELE